MDYRAAHAPHPASFGVTLVLAQLFLGAVGRQRRVHVGRGRVQHELAEAVTTLDRAGMAVSIYNHQLCTLDRTLWPFAQKSVSDWKNAFFEECEACAEREGCGGFFASSVVRRSRGIRALPRTTEG